MYKYRISLEDRGLHIQFLENFIHPDRHEALWFFNGGQFSSVFRCEMENPGFLEGKAIYDIIIQYFEYIHLRESIWVNITTNIYFEFLLLYNAWSISHATAFHLWAQGRIPPLFPCVSYEMTERVSRVTTPVSCVTSTGIPAQSAANILKPPVLNPHSTTYTHGATCCWLGCTTHA